MGMLKKLPFFVFALLIITLALSSRFSSYGGEEGVFNIAAGGSNARPGFSWDSSTGIAGFLHAIQVFDQGGLERFSLGSLRYGQTVSFTVIPGYYAIRIEGRRNGDLKAAGAAGVTINAGRRHQTAEQDKTA